MSTSDPVIKMYRFDPYAPHHIVILQVTQGPNGTELHPEPTPIQSLPSVITVVVPVPAAPTVLQDAIARSLQDDVNAAELIANNDTALPASVITVVVPVPAAPAVPQDAIARGLQDKKTPDECSKASQNDNKVNGVKDVSDAKSAKPGNPKPCTYDEAPLAGEICHQSAAEDRDWWKAEQANAADSRLPCGSPSPTNGYMICPFIDRNEDRNNEYCNKDRPPSFVVLRSTHAPLRRCGA